MCEIVGTNSSADVELLVYELQLKLMLREISFDRIIELFRAKSDADDRISLKGGCRVTGRRVRAVPAVRVNRPPFQLTSRNAMLLARYLVEDSKQHRILFEFACSVQFDIFRSIMKTLFRNFESYTQEEFDAIFSRLKQAIAPKKLPIVDTFFKLYDIRGNFCDYQQLQSNFQSNEISFSPKETNVIILGLFRQSQNLNHLNYNLLFE